MLLDGDKDRTNRLYLDSCHIEKIGNATKQQIPYPQSENKKWSYEQLRRIGLEILARLKQKLRYLTLALQRCLTSTVHT